jgi:MHS family proline/betaine transporter-like MFS transporter
MKEMIEPPVPKAFAVNSMSLLLSVCFMFPLAGMLSDRFGRRKIMIIGGSGLCLLSPLLVMLIGQGSSTLAFISQSLMGICLSFWGAPMCAWLVESFEPEARLTSVAIGYNVAQALAGGSTPFLATLLVDKVGPNSPGWILTLLGTISLTGLLVVAPNRNFASVPTDAVQTEQPEQFELVERTTTRSDSDEFI